MQSNLLLGLYLNIFNYSNVLTKRVLSFMVDHKTILT